MDGVGIYISVPFCRSKCSYCNFASGVYSDGHHARYIDLIVASIHEARQRVAEFSAVLPATVDSIYLGGGTPSLLAPSLLQRVFQALRDEFAIGESAEITLECAPGQLEDDTLAEMAGCGVNRISFGVQSFIDREAAVTGRLHNRATAVGDIERVRRAGIRSVNIDLIAGLPHQTLESWRESLKILVETGSDHASIYMLEVDEDSRLGREILEGGGRYHAGAVPSDDEVAEFYSEAVRMLSGSGLAQYEISNFAVSGRESLHNKKYWLRYPYLGLGLDAHSMLRTPDGGGIRFQTGDDLATFLDGGIPPTPQSISRESRLEEAWFLGLRLNQGLAMNELEREFGYADAHSHDRTLGDLEKDGLIETTAGRVRLTDGGRLLSNEVFGRFLTTDEVLEDSLVFVD